MPGEPLVNAQNEIVGWLTFAGAYKPGDMPPTGYIDKQDWAKVQTKAGLRQTRCANCGLWKFPQEKSGDKCLTCASEAAK